MGLSKASGLSITNPARAASNTQNVSTDFTNVLSLRNRRTYNGYINQVEIEPKLLTIANESAKNVVVELRAATNPNIELDFEASGVNLVSDIALNGVGPMTAGRLLGAFTLGAQGSETIDLVALDIRMPPTLTLVAQAKVNSGAAADVTVTLNWYEDL